MSLCWWKVETAQNAVVALNRLQKRIFTVVLCDVLMPFQAGDELTAIFRRTHKHTHATSVNIVSGYSHLLCTVRRKWELENRPGEVKQPIYALTAYCDDVMKERCKMAGMNDTLEKPLNIQAVQEIVALYHS